MKSLNSRIEKGLSAVILLSLVLVACGGGSSNSAHTYPAGAGGPATPTPAPAPVNPSPTNSGITNPNLMGINIAAPLDYEGDRLYADVVRMSRDFKSGADANSAALAPVDVDGWPTADFSFYVWAGLDKMHGTYTLTFKGQATSVTSNPGGSITVTYDSATNTSTGTLQYTNAGSSFLTLSFAGTKRTSASVSGSGVTAIKLMRPLTPGAAQSYPSSTLFNAPIKALISKFSVIRFMDFLATNSNVQTSWSERPLPSWASFQRKTNVGGYGWQGIGGALEHAVLLANETGKDAWINIPVRADDAYILNLARLLAYGSDGVNPYTGPQASPVYPPLNANLKVYVEYSNELWNSAGPFAQFHDNCQAASDELVRTGGTSPLNWDGSWNSVTYQNTGWDWTMCWRRPAKRSVEISNIFRSVFGDAAMITRIRPVMMTQLTNAGGILFEETKMLLNYYDDMDGSNKVATAHPPSYYLYGAGGSGYYNPASTVSTPDAFFADPGITPAGFATPLLADAQMVAALGLKRVAYEGGPSLDKLGGARDAISPLAINDARMNSAMVNMHNAWSNNSGELFVYFSSTGDYQWGFTPDVYNLATQKLMAIDALNAAERAPLTVGTPVPASLAGSVPNACSRGWGCSPIQSWDPFTADGSKIIWASYSFRSSASAPWTVKLSFTSASSNASVGVYVDGALVGTQSTTGGALSFNAGTVGAGLHGVIVRAVVGSFALNSVAVALN